MALDRDSWWTRVDTSDASGELLNSYGMALHRTYSLGGPFHGGR